MNNFLNYLINHLAGVSKTGESITSGYGCPYNTYTNKPIKKEKHQTGKWWDRFLKK